jgi:hypothetical protein
VLPDSSYDAPSTSWDMTTVSKMGPTTTVRSAKAQGLKAKPASRVKPAQSNQSEGQSEIKGGQQLVHPEPHRGDPTSSSFVSESRAGSFLHTPSCGLAPRCLDFPTRDYSGKTLETTWSGFYWGEGEGHWPMSDPIQRHLPWLALTHER